MKIARSKEDCAKSFTDESLANKLLGVRDISMEIFSERPTHRWLSSFKFDRSAINTLDIAREKRNVFSFFRERCVFADISRVRLNQHIVSTLLCWSYTLPNSIFARRSLIQKRQTCVERTRVVSLNASSSFKNPGNCKINRMKCDPRSTGYALQFSQEWYRSSIINFNCSPYSGAIEPRHISNTPLYTPRNEG